MHFYNFDSVTGLKWKRGVKLDLLAQQAWLSALQKNLLDVSASKEHTNYWMII